MSQPATSAVLPLVTLFESYGSGAEEVGPKVAEALGLPYHAQAFSSEDLEEQENQREKESLLSRVVVAMGHGGVASGGRDVIFAKQDQQALVEENTAQVLAWAEEGGVITGRNGAFILSDRESALHVRLDGQLDQRVRRAAEARGISVDRAHKRQRREDQMRVDMSKQLYAFDSGDPLNYDLTLNTGTLDLDTCVQIIVAAVRIKAGAGAAGGADAARSRS